MKKITRYVALFLTALVFLGAAAGCKKEAAQAGGDGKFKERIRLDIIQYVNSPEPDGRRTDPTSKMLEEKFNIDLYLTGTTEQDYVAQFAAMLAAGDLPDVIYLPADYTRMLASLMASESLLNLEPYINEEHMPNLMADPNSAAMFEAYRGPSFSPDGNAYLWGFDRGDKSDGSMPSITNALLWNAYKKAGYPELDDMGEKFIDALDKMVKAEPTSVSGQKTYGLGGWFGQAAPWGEWVIKFGSTWPDGNEAIESAFFVISVDTDTIKPIPVKNLTDPKSYYWKMMRFFNMAHQRGLLDPDSWTQTSDMYQEKLKDGRYMFNEPGWMAGAANADFRMKGIDKAYISIPAVNGRAEARFLNFYRGERMSGINVKSKGKHERIVALLDYLSTWEFSRITVNGMPGFNWDWVDGKPVPKDEYFDADLADNAWRLKTGAQIYNLFCGYDSGSTDPDGFPLNLYQYSDKAYERKMNGTFKDFLAHYGKERLVDVYKAETPVTTGIIGMLSFAELPDDMNNDLNALNAYVGKNYAKVVTARNDAEFARLRDEFIAGMYAFNPDALYDYFYQQCMDQQPLAQKILGLIKNQ
jgi:ABC-type glycerol-3-phosphate transport system substrate-binding protein